MRKRLRIVIVAIVVLLLGSVGALVGRSMWQQHKKDVIQHGLEFLPGVSQHIQDFRRVKIQDGRKVWEVAAQDAQYFDEDKVIVVRGATLRWFLKDGRVIGLKGDEGRILLDGREVAQVELSGSIEVSLADYTIRAARAVYDHQRSVISAPGAIQISGRAVELTGTGMEVDVDAQRLTLLHRVSMQVQPAILKAQGGGHGVL